MKLVLFQSLFCRVKVIQEEKAYVVLFGGFCFTTSSLHTVNIRSLFTVCSFSSIGKKRWMRNCRQFETGLVLFSAKHFSQNIVLLKLTTKTTYFFPAVKNIAATERFTLCWQISAPPRTFKARYSWPAFKD